MQLQVITSDGRRGQVATTVLEANAFRPVIVSFPEGDSKPYYLRELKIDDRPDQHKRPA
jgi:hypothetical protein